MWKWPSVRPGSSALPVQVDHPLVAVGVLAPVGGPADVRDPVAFDADGSVLDGRAAVAVDQLRVEKQGGRLLGNCCAMTTHLRWRGTPFGRQNLGRSADDGIRERADAVDLDGDDVAGLQVAGTSHVVSLVGAAADLWIGGPSRTPGRARLDQHSRLERVEVREERHQGRHIPDHLGRRVVLSQVAVHVRSQAERLCVGNLVPRDDPRAERRRCVEVLAGAEPILEPPLRVGNRLPVAGRHVVGDGIPEHVLERPLARDVAARLADDHRQFDLVIELLRDDGVEDHRVAGADHGQRRFEEELGIVLLNRRLLLTVIPVVLTAVEDDRGQERREQRDVLERVGDSGMRERLLRGPPGRLEPRDQPSHRMRGCGRPRSPRRSGRPRRLRGSLRTSGAGRRPCHR